MAKWRSLHFVITEPSYVDVFLGGNENELLVQFKACPGEVSFEVLSHRGPEHRVALADIDGALCRLTKQFTAEVNPHLTLPVKYGVFTVLIRRIVQICERQIEAGEYGPAALVVFH